MRKSKFRENFRIDYMTDLHMHTNYSDGLDSIDLMVRTAAVFNMETIAVTDHLYEDNFMNGKSVRQYFDEIDLAAATYSKVKVMKGVEGTLLNMDGKISIPGAHMDKFDVVLVDFAWKVDGVSTNQPENQCEILKNIATAFKNLCSNPGVDVIAHPFNFGRTVERFEFAWLTDDFLEEIAGYFVENDKSFELMNDMWWWFPNFNLDEVVSEYSRIVAVFKKAGVGFVYGSDAHSHQGVGNFNFVKVINQILPS